MYIVQNSSRKKRVSTDNISNDNNEKKMNFLHHEWKILRFIMILSLISIGFNGFLLSSSQDPDLIYTEYGVRSNPFGDQSYDEILSSIPGRIPILMYHNIITPSNKHRFQNINARNQRYFVTSRELEEQLNTLYALGYRNISLDEYLSLMKGEKKSLDRLSPGTRPFVLTFDDATFGQFDFIGKDEEGNYLIDPDCAVGIMLRFSEKNPPFKLNAAFSIDFDNPPFLVAYQVEQKLNLLLDYGFEIVNHTATHKKLAPLLARDPARVDYEIGKAMEQFESFLGYRVSTIDKICYPGGKENPQIHDYVKEIRYNGNTYKFIAALDAEGMQAFNPNTPQFRPFDISRIEVNTGTFNRYIVNAPDIYKTPALTQEEDSSVLARITDSILEDK